MRLRYLDNDVIIKTTPVRKTTEMRGTYRVWGMIGEWCAVREMETLYMDISLTKISIEEGRNYDL